jgi:outer membrane protein TolC
LNRIGSAWLTALVILLVTGCAVNQAREVQTYRKVLDAGQEQPPTPFSENESMTLKRALTLANANNEQLAMAGEDYLQALIDKDRAFARFLPSIRFAPSFMRQEKSSLASGNPLVASIIRPETRDEPLQAHMALNPFQDVPGIWAAASSAERQRALLLDRQSILLLDVAQTYYQVMRSEQQVRVLEHSVQMQQQRVNDLDVQRRAGVATAVDVAQSQAQLAGTRNALIQARSDVRNGRAMLAQLLGVTAVEGPLAGGFDAPAENRSADQLLVLAASHRQDLNAARMQVKAAAERLESAWGGYFPSVTLDLSRYLYRESFPADVDWTGLLQINLPIFSAGLVHADVRTAYSRLRQAHLAETGLQRAVLKQLRVGVEDLSSDLQQIDQLGIRTAAAQEAVRQADAAFAAGLGTNLERLVAQDQLLSAELALNEEQFNHSIDYLRLLRAVGLLNTGLAPMPPNSGDPASQPEGRTNLKPGAVDAAQHVARHPQSTQ